MSYTTAEEYLPLLHEVLAESNPGLTAMSVGPDVSLMKEVGLDSLAVTRFAMELEKALGRTLTLESWLATVSGDGKDTLRELAAWLAGEGAAH